MESDKTEGQRRRITKEIKRVVRKMWTRKIQKRHMLRKKKTEEE